MKRMGRVVGLAIVLLGGSGTAVRAQEASAAGSGDQQAQDPGTSEARALFLQGSDAYEAGEFERALDLFEQAFSKATPEKRIYILYNIGVCHDQLGHAEEALEHYQQYLRLVPEGPRHQWVRGRVRLLERQLGQGGAAPQRAAAPDRGAEATDEGEQGAEGEATPRPGPLSPVPEASEEEASGGGAWWPWAVAGGVVAVGATVAIVLLTSGGGGDPADDYTFGVVYTLR